MEKQGRQRRCVFVVGPEGSGSMLAAKIVAHVLGVRSYGHWDPPVGWSHSDLSDGQVSDVAQNNVVAARIDTVCHRSLPYGRTGDMYPDLDRWRWSNRDALTQFVITTRDVSIVDRSKRSGREVSGQEDLPEPSTQPNLEEIDRSGRLFRLVEQLPADQRRVIGMRFAEEKSIREIATELGRSEGAVKQLQFRALQNLRARMEGANA